MDTIQSRLKQKRMVMKLTQKDVAIALGVTQQTYQEIESGKTKDMRISTLIKLCEILSVTPNYLLGIGESGIEQVTPPSVKRKAKLEYAKAQVIKK